MNIFQHRLFHTAILVVAIVLFTVAAFADENGYAVELLHYSSDHRVEGQVDTRFDQRLFNLGRSTSEHLFDPEPMRRYGAMISKYAWHGNTGIEYGGFVDPTGTIVGHSDLGDIHARYDSVGVFGLAGYRYGRVAGYAGAYAAYTEVDVHSWLPIDATNLDEYHDTYHDFSSGLMVKVTVDLFEGVGVACNALNTFGDVDKIGSDRVIGCGVRYAF